MYYSTNHNNKDLEQCEWARNKNPGVDSFPNTYKHTHTKYTSVLLGLTLKCVISALRFNTGQVTYCVQAVSGFYGTVNRFAFKSKTNLGTLEYFFFYG